MSSTIDRFALVTGTSSGIGEATARILLERGWRVAGVARRAAAIDHPGYDHVLLDLARWTDRAAEIERTLVAWLDDSSWTRVGLVNNAALPGLIGTFATMDAARFSEVMAANLAAPVWLMSVFLRATRPGVALRIVNVSTGAAVQPLPGLGAYGSSKAGLRMASMIAGAELEGAGGRPNTSVLSFAPGVVDTPMQAEARSTPADRLPAQEMFLRFKAEERLIVPAVPAATIADYLGSDGHQTYEERRQGQ